MIIWMGPPKIGYYLGMANLQYITTRIKLDNLPRQQPTGGPIENRTKRSQPLLCASSFTNFSLIRGIRHQASMKSRAACHNVSSSRNKYTKYFTQQHILFLTAVFAVSICALNYIIVSLNQIIFNLFFEMRPRCCICHVLCIFVVYFGENIQWQIFSKFCPTSVNVN